MKKAKGFPTFIVGCTIAWFLILYSVMNWMTVDFQGAPWSVMFTVGILLLPVMFRLYHLLDSEKERQ